MAAKLLSLNSLIERTRRRRRKPNKKELNEQKKIIDEELDIVKAAAWAWYERSNSCISEGIIKATSFDELDPITSTTRHQRDPKPSRYKLEAMRLMSSSSSKELDHNHITDGLSLLDAHEIRSISMRLDSLILEESHNKLCNGCGDDDDDDINGGGRKKKKKKGIWGIHGVMCSTKEEDVADGIIGRRRSVPVVHLPKCLPRV